MPTLSLDRGIRLENRRRVLPWSVPPEDLRRIARPLESPGDITFNYSDLLVWPDVRVLGGLRCTVTTPLRRKRFRVAQLIPYANRSPKRLFAWVNEHMNELLGFEPRFRDDGWCPMATWRVGPARIRSELHDKNGLYHVLLVEHVARA